MPVHREQPAQADVAAGVGVPLRQHEHGRARVAPSPSRAPESSRQYTVLFSGCGVSSALGNVSSRSPSADGALERVVGRSAPA